MSITSKATGIGRPPNRVMVLVIQDRMPAYPIIPHSPPSQKARLREAPCIAASRGIKATQARAVRSNLGKQKIRRIPERTAETTLRHSRRPQIKPPRRSLESGASTAGFADGLIQDDGLPIPRVHPPRSEVLRQPNPTPGRAGCSLLFL